MARRFKIDNIDFKIFKILQERGRVTNLQLSKEINLSPAPTLERVKKLERAGIIKSYHAELDADALGLGIQAIIQVTLARQHENPIHSFVEQIKAIPEVIECFQVTGNFDYELRVMTRDIHHLNEIITVKLSKIEEIGEFQSSIILATIKKSHIIPLNYG